MKKDFHLNNFITITIDGESACGKNSLGLKLSKSYNLKYIDSGSIVRLFSYLTLQNQDLNYSEIVNWQAYDYIDDDTIFYEKSNIAPIIKSEKVASLASKLGKNKIYADYFIEIQRKIKIETEKKQEYEGVVFSGRNGGYLVFPHAELKFFLTATPEVRTLRRLQELKKFNVHESFNSIYSSIINRDMEDKAREYAALKPSEDSIIIDTTHLSLDDVFTIVKNELESLQ
jgi:CMP/dCMP kinase